MTEPDRQLVALFHKKIEHIASISEHNSVATEHFDQLRVFIDAKPELFPEQVRKIVESPGSSSSSRHRAILRIQAIYEALDQIPSGLTTGNTIADPALIPTFELSDDDIARVSELCGDMRKIILSSDSFDQPHRVRLLNRIAAIETEVQKPRGMFDVVRGGIDDLGETLGKFGTNIKPLTDRMKEVVSITRRGTREYDKLPEPEEVKQLPPPSEGNED